MGNGAKKHQGAPGAVQEKPTPPQGAGRKPGARSWLSKAVPSPRAPFKRRMGCGDPKFVPLFLLAVPGSVSSSLLQLHIPQRAALLCLSPTDGAHHTPGEFFLISPSLHIHLRVGEIKEKVPRTYRARSHLPGKPPVHYPHAFSCVQGSSDSLPSFQKEIWSCSVSQCSKLPSHRWRRERCRMGTASSFREPHIRYHCWNRTKVCESRGFWKTITLTRCDFISLGAF